MRKRKKEKCYVSNSSKQVQHIPFDTHEVFVAFPGFDGIADTTPLCRWLRAERETAVVPGRFFGDPSRIRLAAGTSAEVLGPGLERLAEGIERHR